MLRINAQFPIEGYFDNDSDGDYNPDDFHDKYELKLVKEPFDSENLVNENETCGICHDPLSEKGVLTVCNHYYHEECIMQWFGEGNDKKCPVCRYKFDTTCKIDVSDFAKTCRSDDFNSVTSMTVDKDAYVGTGSVYICDLCESSIVYDRWHYKDENYDLCGSCYHKVKNFKDNNGDINDIAEENREHYGRDIDGFRKFHIYALDLVNKDMMEDMPDNENFANVIVPGEKLKILHLNDCVINNVCGNHFQTVNLTNILVNDSIITADKVIGNTCRVLNKLIIAGASIIKLDSIAVQDAKALRGLFAFDKKTVELLVHKVSVEDKESNSYRTVGKLDLPNAKIISLENVSDKKIEFVGKSTFAMGNELEGLDIVGFKFMVPVTIPSFPTTLKHIYLSGCFTNHFDHFDFGGLMSLTKMQISKIKVKTITLGPNVKCIKLDCLPLSNLLGDFSDELEFLQIENCSKFNFERDISTLNNLGYLILGNMVIKKLVLPKNIKKVTLVKNKMEELGYAEELVQLDEFIVAHNKLTELFTVPTTVVKFICMDNFLTKLKFAANDKVEYINCQDNYITEIDVPNNKFKELKTMHAAKNKLSSLPTMKKIGELDISRNNIRKLDMDIKCLKCSKNKMTSLRVTNVEQLICDKNCLEEITIVGKRSPMDLLNLGALFENSISINAEQNPLKRLNLPESGKFAEIRLTRNPRSYGNNDIEIVFKQAYIGCNLKANGLNLKNKYVTMKNDKKVTTLFNKDMEKHVTNI